MHQRLVNSARLELRIRPFGPLLIKSGIETPDPTRPGLEFVRTHHARLGETVYLPGTSLKGAFRGHAERALRGRGLEICDPLTEAKSPCRQSHQDDKTSTAKTFARQCPACRTFGSLKVAGRLNFSDGMPWRPGADAEEQRSGRDDANRTEARFQVGISRDNGAVQSRALYDLELVVGGEFFSEIHLRNFELWQLALVLALVDDLNHGIFAIGFGKSRGLGRVRAQLVTAELELAGNGGELYGSAVGLEDNEHGLYGGKDDRVPLPPSFGEFLEASWRGHRLKLADADALEQVAGLVLPRLEAFMNIAPKARGSHARS